MRRIILLVTVAAVMAAMMAVGALPALAHDGSVSPHQHYLITHNKEKVVRVGPNVCANPANPNAQQGQGFHNFHDNVHVDKDHPADVTKTTCSEPPPSS